MNMKLQNRIEITQRVMMDLNPSSSTANFSVETAYGAKGRTSSFAAVAAGVFSMAEQLYIAAYSHIDSEGGVLYRDCSKTVMRSRLYSNTASQVNIKIKYRIFFVTFNVIFE
ncbi:MAG: hypothetical protein L6282_15700 [Candidatus Methanoperedenaceae archaeon]|nr:hypothetical protein [Candidatus Methanoperedenaceae archaeon]